MFGHVSKSHCIHIFPSIYSIMSFHYPSLIPFCMMHGGFEHVQLHLCDFGQDLFAQNMLVETSASNLLWTYMVFHCIIRPFLLLAKKLVDQRWNTWRVKICDAQPNLPLTFVLLLFPMRFLTVMFLRNLNAQWLRNKPISESCRSSKSDRNRWIRWTGRVKKLPSCGYNCDVPL